MFFKTRARKPVVSIAISIATMIFSQIAFADDCVDWFRDSKLKPGASNCELTCKTMMVDMATFMCHERCDEFCKLTKCKSDPYWEGKIKSGAPSGWPLKSEQQVNWAPEERKTVLSFLSRLPDRLKKTPLDGVFRMRKSIEIINPATTSAQAIVLYDRAFNNPFWKTDEVITHEIGHVVFNALDKKTQNEYRKALGWFATGKDIFSRQGAFISSRAQDSPEEDFAENFSAFLLKRNQLTQKVPAAEIWFKAKLGGIFNLKEGCDEK